MAMANGRVKAVLRPTPLPVVPENVPSDLAKRHAWLVWRYEWQSKKDGGGKWKKPPYSPTTGRKANITDRSHRGSFAEALAAMKSGAFAGIGIVLEDERSKDADLTLYGLDIDDCRDPQTGKVDDEATRIITGMATYTEVSPSGSGVRLFFYADLPTVGMRRGRVELYAHGRYLTVTGQRLDPCPDGPRARQRSAGKLLSELQADADRKTSKPRPVVSAALTDEEIVNRCLRSRSGVAFRELLGGGNGLLKSDSEGDLAFCSRIAFYTQDPEQIVRVWRGSPRWRPKCEANPTYAGRTVRRAIETCTRYFDPGFRRGRPGSLSAGKAPDVPEPPADSRTPNPAPETPPHCVRQEEPAAAKKEEPADGGMLRMSEVKPRPTRWFWEGWIPYGEATNIIGPGGAGKSTLFAHLCSMSEGAIILPGHEEAIDGPLATRIRAICPNADRIYSLPGHEWTFPSATKRLIERVKATRSNLVLIDPIDSYTEDGFSESSGTMVRTFLESFVRVAHETGAAVVYIRHPGKDPRNLCPGSRQWRAVPRQIIELVVGSEMPPQRFMHLNKDNLNAGTPDTYYDLVPLGPRQPCRFVLRGKVQGEEATIARTVAAGMERSLLEDACDLIRDLVREEPQDSSYCYRWLAERGILRTTAYLAAKKLGVVMAREGEGRGLKHTWGAPKDWGKPTA